MPAPGRSRRPIFLIALGAVAVGAIGLGVFFFGGDAPAPPSLGSPSPGSSLASSAGPTPAASAEPASASPSGGATEVPAGIEGAWAVDTSVGSFADFSGTWVGFRVDEVLDGVGSTQAVGRTPGVSGALTIAGTTLTEVRIEADMTRIVSDRSRRDGAIQRTLETGSFPRATFELAAPIELGPNAAAGEVVTATAAGRLTVHGVTRDVVVALEARLLDGRIQVVGTTPFAFADYGMSAPQAPIVLSVSDTGTIEFQVFFAR